MSAELSEAGGPTVGASEPAAAELVSLEVLVKVFAAVVVALLVSPFGARASALGAVLGTFLGDAVKRIVIRQGWGKRRLGALTPLLVLLQIVDNSTRGPLRRLGEWLPSPGGGAHAATVGHAAATSAAAVTITFAAVAVPEAAVGHSLVTDRKSTFFSDASAYPVTMMVREPDGHVTKVKAQRGHEAVYSFEAGPGARVLAAATQAAYEAAPDLALRGPGLDPAQNPQLTHDIDNDHDDLVEATLSGGTYSLVLVPRDEGDVTATVRLFLVPADTAGPVEPSSSGTVAEVSTTAPGQRTVLTFSGRKGERVFFRFSNVELDQAAETVYVTLAAKRTETKAPGFAPTSVGADGGAFEATLNGDDDYVLTLDPSWTARLTRATVTAYEVTSNPSTPFRPASGGARTGVSTTVPGQAAELRFDGHRGERVFFRFTDVKIAAGASVRPAIAKKNAGVEGPTVVSGNAFGAEGGELEAVLNGDDTYTVSLDPSGSALLEGATVTAYEVPSDRTLTLTLGGGPATVRTTVPGERAAVHFLVRGRAHVRFAFKGFRIEPGDGSATMTLYPGSGESSTYVTFVTLPNETGLEANLVRPGEYTLLFDPKSFATAALTISGSR